MDIPPWAEYAQPVLDRAETVLGRTDAKGNRYKLTPDMDKTLEKVEQHDIDCGIKTRKKGFALFEYANLWQMMCGTAHAHLVRLARSSETHMRIAVSGAAVGTFSRCCGRRRWSRPPTRRVSSRPSTSWASRSTGHSRARPTSASTR